MCLALPVPISWCMHRCRPHWWSGCARSCPVKPPRNCIWRLAVRSTPKPKATVNICCILPIAMSNLSKRRGSAAWSCWYLLYRALIGCLKLSKINLPRKKRCLPPTSALVINWSKSTIALGEWLTPRSSKTLCWINGKSPRR